MSLLDSKAIQITGNICKVIQENIQTYKLKFIFYNYSETRQNIFQTNRPKIL